MKNSSMFVFATVVLLVTFPSHAKDPALQALEYEFVAGKEEVAILSKMETAIEQQLTIIDFETMKGGEEADCVRFNRKGRKFGNLRYACATTEKVYKVMTYQYFVALDPKSPVNNITASISPGPISCSVGGCSNPAHRGSQPCILGFENFFPPKIYCRHDPYTADHKCLVP